MSSIAVPTTPSTSVASRICRMTRSVVPRSPGCSTLTLGPSMVRKDTVRIDDQMTPDRRLPKSYVYLVLLAAAIQVPAYGWQAAVPARTIQVSDDQLMRDVRVLAADDMEGRRVGTPGGAKARAYVLQRFKEIGLKPAGTSFEQTFRFSGRGEPADRTGTNLTRRHPRHAHARSLHRHHGSLRPCRRP